MQHAKTVDDYIRNANAWQDKVIQLRDILRATPR